MEKSKRKRTNPGKGSNYERDIAKKLSLWASDDKHDDWIWRTSSSGARAKTRSKQGKSTANSCGDIKPEHMRAFFLFKKCTWELKNGYGTYCLLDVIDNTIIRKNQKNEKIQKIEAFARQSKEDAKNAKVPFPMIITRKDKRESILWMPTAFFDLFEDLSEYPYIYFSGNDKMDEYVAMNLDLFLLVITPEMFEEAMND